MQRRLFFFAHIIFTFTFAQSSRLHTIVLVSYALDYRFILLLSANFIFKKLFFLFLFYLFFCAHKIIDMYE